jgi:hypothetical protein
MTRTLPLVAALAVCATLLAPALAAKDLDASKLPPPSDKKGITYVRDIRPILEKTCFGCHGADKAKGNIRLDSLERIIKGGDDGKIVVAGSSDRSLLAYAVARTQVKKMPPPDKGEPLTREQAGLIRAWIDQGLK